MPHPTRTWLAAVIALCAAILLVRPSPGQSPAAPEFEVASIKPASPPTPETFRSGQFRAGTKITAGSADFEFVSLADLIPYAWRVKSFQVTGPASLRESHWNIVARLPQGASQDQVPEMLQSLLADRFHLAVHHEKRDQPVYELIVAKGGPKLEPADASDTPADAQTTGPGGPAGFLPPFGGPPPGGAPGRGPGDGPPNAGGGRGMVVSGGTAGSVRITPDPDCGMHLEFTSLTMSSFADTLTPFLDRPVLDATGLKGSYKASLKLPMEVMFTMMQNMVRNSGLAPPPGGGPGGPGGRGGGDQGPGRGPGGCDPGAAFNGGDTSSAALFQAVQQLGLKLQARKAPFDTIVVDRVDKTPTEN
jgi:uncharacterized protein (TIGR03435 family)